MANDLTKLTAWKELEGDPFNVPLSLINSVGLGFRVFFGVGITQGYRLLMQGSGKYVYL